MRAAQIVHQHVPVQTMKKQYEDGKLYRMNSVPLRLKIYTSMECCSNQKKKMQPNNICNRTQKIHITKRKASGESERQLGSRAANVLTRMKYIGQN